MKGNPCVEAVTAELGSANVPYDVEPKKTHTHIRYGDDRQHLHVVASTPSDWRAPLNERAEIRRKLEEHGYVDSRSEMVLQDAALVDLKDGEARCYSYNIAEHFSKAHKDVLRAIDKVRADCGSEFDQRNFAPIDYIDAKGRKYRAYSMTRDGFSLVVMGFTGSAATKWKIKYIDAFNSMARELSSLFGGEDIERLTGEVETMASMLADMENRIDCLPQPRKAPFVRPSIIRRQKREIRAARRAVS